MKMRAMCLLVASVFVYLALPAHTSAAQTLYGVTGAGNAPSSLYTVDPVTGSTVLIGATGFSHVTGIDFDPTSGTLYGVVSDLFYSGTTLLLTIDQRTGAGTVIGSTANQIPDITIGPDGVIRGWTEGGTGDDDPITIDKLTGTVTVTASPLGTSHTGVATQDAGHLYVKPSRNLYSVDVVSGAFVFLWTFPDSMDNILENEVGGTLISGERDKTGTQLYRLDPTTGSQTSLGHSDQQLSALAFSTATPIGAPVLSPFMLVILVFGVVLTGVFTLRRRQLPG